MNNLFCVSMSKSIMVGGFSIHDTPMIACDTNIFYILILFSIIGFSFTLFAFFKLFFRECKTQLKKEKKK